MDETDIKKWELIGKPDCAANYAKEAHVVGSADNKAISSNAHQILVEDMVESVKTDREPWISGEEGRKAVDLILAIYESSRTGKEIEL